MVLLLIDTHTAGARGRNASAPIAVLGIQSETAVLARRMTHKHTVVLAGIPFVTGRLGRSSIVLARCGVGKVNAAVTAILLIDHFHPQGILFTGSAGALNPDLGPGDVVIGLKTAQHDVGVVTAKGMQREPTDGIAERTQNPMFFAADARLLAAAEQASGDVQLQPFQFGGVTRTPRIVRGVIVTGDVFVADQTLNDDLRKSLSGDAVEEEGAAVAQVCWEQHVPYLAIRSISDNANNETPVNYQRFYLLAAENSARLVNAILARLRGPSD
jgi:adenosylhomocysteine nucleosidase